MKEDFLHILDVMDDKVQFIKDKEEKRIIFDVANKIYEYLDYVEGKENE